MENLEKLNIWLSMYKKNNHENQDYYMYLENSFL